MALRNLIRLLTYRVCQTMTTLKLSFEYKEYFDQSRCLIQDEESIASTGLWLKIKRV